MHTCNHYYLFALANLVLSSFKELNTSVTDVWAKEWSVSFANVGLALFGEAVQEVMFCAMATDVIDGDAKRLGFFIHELLDGPL